MRNVNETALLIAVLVKRSEERRVRVSDKTIKLLARRERLRSAFIANVTDVLATDFGLCMIELDTGGFGIVHAKSLEGAKTVTAKRLMNDKELKSIIHGRPVDFEEFLKEVNGDADDDLGDAE